jgi:hypothetical protein
MNVLDNTASVANALFFQWKKKVFL